VILGTAGTFVILAKAVIETKGERDLP